MTLFDMLLVLIVLGGLVFGFRKGLVRQVASLVSWAVGIAVCLLFREQIAAAFLAVNPSAAQWPLAGVTVKAVSLALVFMVVTLLLRGVAFLLRGAIKAVHLGCLDSWGGAALFVFKYVFALSIVLNLLYAFNPDSETFGTRHMLNNRPYEMTLDLMPRVLGSDEMPSDSLLLYRMPLDEPQPTDDHDA